LSSRHILISRHVTFDKHTFPYASTPQPSTPPTNHDTIDPQLLPIPPTIPMLAPPPPPTLPSAVAKNSAATSPQQPAATTSPIAAAPSPATPTQQPAATSFPTVAAQQPSFPHVYSRRPPVQTPSTPLPPPIIHRTRSTTGRLPPPIDKSLPPFLIII
jgi:hypothetical protein